MTEKTCGDILREVRLRRGMRQREVALRLDVSIPYLSQVENDLKRPSIDFLRAFCEAMSVDDMEASSLYRTYNERFDALGSSDMDPLSRVALARFLKELKAMDPYARHDRLRELNLLRIEWGQVGRMMRSFWLCRRMTREALVAAANLLRRRLGFSPAEFLPITQLFDRLTWPRILVVTDDLIPPNVEGFALDWGDRASAIEEGKYVVVSATCYDQAEAGVGRARFTIAHELAHCLLHRRLEAVERIPGPLRDPEWQADQYAAELLVPHRALHSRLSPDDVACRHQVSLTVAERQLAAYLDHKRRNGISEAC